MKDEKAVVATTQERNVTDGVLSRVQKLSSQGDLVIPKNYSAENALKSAWLILQGVQDKNGKPALEVCTKDSMANALMDMVVQGLNPVKKQCYFVVYGNKLTLMRSYMGSAAVTKTLKGVKDVYANVIYENDEFDYELDLETGLKKITKHNQSFKNIDPAKIDGAYAVIVKEDGKNYVEVMNMGQIRKSWAQGAAKGNSGAHQNFADEMAKKTVINRACKMFINTSDDSDLLVDTFDRTSDERAPEDTENMITDVEYEVKEEVKAKGNSKNIDIVSPTLTNDREENTPQAAATTKGREQVQIVMDEPGF